MTNQPLYMNRNPLAAANMVNQLFNAGDPDQYKRELVQNAIDAGATDIEAGAIRLADLGEKGGVKAAFIDNGRGMSATKLADYIGELFNGASEVDAQGNYNMGGRVATLPFNPFGVIWASWVEGDPEGSFIVFFILKLSGLVSDFCERRAIDFTTREGRHGRIDSHAV